MYRDAEETERSILVLGIHGVLIGLDRTNGTQRWEVRLGEYGVVEIAIRRGVVYASAGRQLHRIVYLTGEVLGVTDTPIEIGTRPTISIDRDSIFLATGGEIVCLDLDGRVLWHNRLKGRGYGTIALGFPGNVRQGDLDK
jgi:outer membrane protein assembly factor BamB